MRQNSSGFTIVELLIVVVVIAILATIGMVSYQGIKSRAQSSLVQSDVRSIGQRIEVARVENGGYPALIDDCPSPAGGNLCLASSGGTTFRYDNGTSSAGGYGGYAGKLVGSGYNLGIMAQDRFLYVGSVEREGSNEFLQYVNLAPYIDKYGLKKYRLSFDIKSTDSSVQSTISIYFQNGSTAKYSMSPNQLKVTASGAYTNHVIEFTPSLSNTTDTQSILAFYGAYGTGNRPVVKNVRFELAN